MSTGWKIVDDAEYHMEAVVMEPWEDEPEVASYEAAAKATSGIAADAKWDGCVHLIVDGAYIHICNLPGFIAKLTTLCEMANERFPAEQGYVRT